jgi:hypothetical protein
VIVSTDDNNARAIREESEKLLVAWPYPAASHLLRRGATLGCMAEHFLENIAVAPSPFPKSACRYAGAILKPKTLPSILDHAGIEAEQLRGLL